MDATKSRAAVLHRDEGAGSWLEGALTSVASGYCWTVLALNTVSLYALGIVAARLRPGTDVWGWILHAWARINLHGGRFQVRVEGAPASGPMVLVANHQSVFDVALLAALVPPPLCFVARRELFAVPIIGGVLRRGRHIAVERGGRAAVKASVEEAVRYLRAGGRVVFFAEGTRSPDGRVRRFKSGAFRAARRAGCPLVPVAIAGTRHAIGKGSRSIRPARLAACFLPPIEPASDEDPRRLQRRVRSQVARQVESLEREVGPRVPDLLAMLRGHR